jgi:hypothetical protein
MNQGIVWLVAVGVLALVLLSSKKPGGGDLTGPKLGLEVPGWDVMEDTFSGILGGQ